MKACVPDFKFSELVIVESLYAFIPLAVIEINVTTHGYLLFVLASVL